MYTYIYTHNYMYILTNTCITQHSCKYNIITRDITCIMQCTNIHTHTCTYINCNTHTHVWAQAHTYTHTHTHTDTHAHTHKMHIQTHLKEGRYYQCWHNSLQTHDMPDHSNIHLHCMNHHNIP